jgi:hypothetical protein
MNAKVFLFEWFRKHLKNTQLFFISSWWEETSWFDKGPNTRWIYEYPEREYRCKIPAIFEDCQYSTEFFLEWMLDNYPDEVDFYEERCKQIC